MQPITTYETSSFDVSIDWSAEGSANNFGAQVGVDFNKGNFSNSLGIKYDSGKFTGEGSIEWKDDAGNTFKFEGSTKDGGTLKVEGKIHLN